MNKDEIVEVVQHYVQDDMAKYALMINGAWGSGKTFLYENYLIEAISKMVVGKNEMKYNIYVSLYGIPTVEELSKQIVSNYLLYAKANGNEIVKKGAKSLAGIIGIVSKAISFSVGSISADFSNILQEISGLVEVKNLVICLDDLERCTIPINEFFGYINNLIEHCESKVIILADENNIGKIYANSNVEQKYQTILTGNRKVIQNPNKDNVVKNNNSVSDYMTINELKNLNEILYSENYIYRDIKEKVIGKICNYNPDIKKILCELISCNDNRCYIANNEYREFIKSNMEKIASAFDEVDNRNLRITIMWLDMFEKIYKAAYKNMKTSKYYEEIICEFLRYSIWAVVASRTNKKIYKSTNYGSLDYVYFEGREYTHTIRYSFIDKYIRINFLDDEDLVKAARNIEKNYEREEIYNKKQLKSEGGAFSDLSRWCYMEDDEVRENIQRLLDELRENKYVYRDYSKIIDLLLFFNKIGLYEKEDINNVQKIMLSLIDKDNDVQEENDEPRSFDDIEDKKKYESIYLPIAERRKRRNAILEKSEIDDENIYKNADAFFEHCKKREQYYCNHKSFMEYIDIAKLIELINAGSLEDVYTITASFKKIYFMGNLSDFYTNDIDALQELKRNLHNESKINVKGITRKYAIKNLINEIEKVLKNLGVEENDNDMVSNVYR
jgi:DNA polymerase III delta prime subunit